VKRADRTIRVWEVLVDGAGEGPAGDGTYVRRFGSEREAVGFASQATCYGGPATVDFVDAPARLAGRWGFA
jgi:hypothetical protein